MTGLDLLRVVFAWIVLAVWVGSIVLDAVEPTYEPPYSIHLLVTGVAALLFGPKITGRNGNGKKAT